MAPKLPSFTFPIRGLYFFITHPKQLWLVTLSPIILTLIFSAFSIGISIRFLLPALVDKFLEWNWPHWMSWFVSIVSTILEGAILNLIFFMVLTPIFQDLVFDRTLKARGLERIFEDEEERDDPKLVICWRNLRSSVLVTLCLILVKILFIILTAPLQLIPVLGTALACYISGWPTAWSQRLHYDIELRGFKVSESYHRARDHKWDYASFGSVAFGLELIPVFNIVFLWTNIVGASLWIAEEYEKEMGITKDTKKQDREVYPVAQAPSTSTEQTPLLQHQQDA
ncbi:unnamed protein product [Mucor circinelloides]|uniref:Sulfate transporter CysZ n=1 Tax=Mucor circinelloides f. circinelloides (strain 1006PhL) TaxID=1220926 RepID=S2JZW0_MUCC1|nr:hypothetical protein HMPREF1544_04850 [Mucor circinelloides 1006PhL]KAG1106295.1 hypothetical protein G6F42_016808 [Rhizopus arrhizus]